MATFETGIQRYIHASATVVVHFPVDHNGREYVCCKHCPFLSSNERMCQLNKKPVHFPDRYIGPACPLTEMEA